MARFYGAGGRNRAGKENAMMRKESLSRTYYIHAYVHFSPSLVFSFFERQNALPGRNPNRDGALNHRFSTTVSDVIGPTGDRIIFVVWKPAFRIFRG